jgi:hypothetical protein
MMAGDKKLYLVIGCDTDPDRVGFIENVSSDTLSWRGLSEGIPRAKEMLRDIKDVNGGPPAITWLIRADEQIRHIYGNYNWVLSEFRQTLSDLETSGDEIGWHPHLYKFDPRYKIWFQELNDTAWQCDMLETAFNSFDRIFPGRPVSVRTGWVYHNNETMKKLDELGVKVDFSAVPGLKTLSKNNAKYPYNIYDWYITPKRPYHPSETDYRRAIKEGESELSILEVPNFTSNSFFWGIMAGLQMARKMKNPIQFTLAIKKPTYWINLTGGPHLYNPLVKTLERRLKNNPESQIFFITYFHSDELIENNSLIYSRDNIKQNLINISAVCRKLNIPFEFIRARDIPARINY